ncbi:hypothetical protein VTI74DRAFT_5163 [Chaetomium olivicolor]
MTDVASPPGEPRSQIPGPTSALRGSRPTPRRVPTRVSIVAPKGSTTTTTTTNIPSARSASSGFRSPDLIVTSTPWAKKLILTLDGGGIRGYSSLIILRAIMREIARIEQTLEPHASSSAHTDKIPRDQIPDDVYREGKYLPCHYFDYIAGTSVGGLIAIMLGMLGQSVDDCIGEFHRQHKAIPVADDASAVSAIDFPLTYRRNTWPTKRTRAFFDTFAKFTVTATAARTMTNASATSSTSPASSQVSAASSEFRKDTYQCQTLAWCTEVEPQQRSRRPYAFCSYAEEEHDQLISIPEVAKAITTPSSYAFKPFKLGSGHFVDGSKQIRDPTLEVLKELTALLSDDPPTTTTTTTPPQPLRPLQNRPSTSSSALAPTRTARGSTTCYAPSPPPPRRCQTKFPAKPTAPTRPTTAFHSRRSPSLAASGAVEGTTSPATCSTRLRLPPSGGLRCRSSRRRSRATQTCWSGEGGRGRQRRGGKRSRSGYGMCASMRGAMVSG